MRIHIFLIIAGVFFCTTLSAQEKTRYTAEFRFERGIYPSIDHWKNNQPVKPEEILTDLERNSSKFFQLLFAQESFRYPENNQIVYKKPDELFGYSNGVQVFYKTSYRFEVIGSVCLLKEVGLIDSYSSFIKPGEAYEAARKKGSGKLYILDFETGKFFKLKPKKAIAILKRDPEIYQQYKKSKGKKKERVLDAIKEYNFKYPAYFPEY